MRKDHPNAASPEATNLAERVEGRFGVLPNFFRLTPETPEITEKLWGFAEAAYLDNPLPSVFKERLFVHLSRFCAVRYCITRHVGFLVGLGRPSGDPNVPTQSVSDVVRLLRRRFPRGEELQSCLSLCAASPAPLAEMPTPDKQMEDAVFALAGHVFLKTTDYLSCLDALARLFGPVRLQYLVLFLAFVRAAHYWTEIHPEIECEDDINELVKTHEALAECIQNDPESRSDVDRLLLGELAGLTLKADKAVGLLASIVNSSEDAIVSKTLDGTITSWNRGAERLFGYTAKEAVGQHITLIIPENRWSEETLIIDKIKRGERLEHFDTVRMRKDKTEIDIALTISPVRDASGKIIGASKIARDITQRKRLERELRDGEERYRTLADALNTQVGFRTQELERRNSELRELSARLLESQDAERRHIARELHDSAGQTLAALSLNLAEIEDARTNPERHSKGVEETKKLLQHLNREIRTTSYLLHPPGLDEAGLSSALEWYVQGLNDRSGLDINLTIPEKFERLPADMELVVFRIVQESLTNVHRHSGSKTASIRVSRDADRIVVKIEDKGRGIPPEKLTQIQSQGSGVGISGMRERLRHFNGDLLIESNGTGTTMTAILPIEQSSKAPTRQAYDRVNRPAM